MKDVKIQACMVDYYKILMPEINEGNDLTLMIFLEVITDAKEKK